MQSLKDCIFLFHRLCSIATIELLLCHSLVLQQLYWALNAKNLRTQPRQIPTGGKTINRSIRNVTVSIQ